MRELLIEQALSSSNNLVRVSLECRWWWWGIHVQFNRTCGASRSSLGTQRWGGLIHPDTSFVSAPQLLTCTHTYTTMHKRRQNVHTKGIFSAYSKHNRRCLDELLRTESWRHATLECCISMCRAGEQRSSFSRTRSFQRWGREACKEETPHQANLVKWTLLNYFRFNDS